MTGRRGLLIKAPLSFYCVRGGGIQFSAQFIMLNFIVLQMSFGETTSGFILVVTVREMTVKVMHSRHGRGV